MAEGRSMTDHAAVHAPGASNFTPSPHRMPSVSAAQALQDLSSPSRSIRSTLTHLDSALRCETAKGDQLGSNVGGFPRGKVTEIYGPPGVGKTALCMQLAASALQHGQSVIWVDTDQPLLTVRFLDILKSIGLSGKSSANNKDLSDVLESFEYFSAPTLSYLIALLSHPSSTFPPPSTSLIVIDSVSALVSSAFPPSGANAATLNQSSAVKFSARKSAICHYLINLLQKLATTRDIAIVVCNQCVTRIRFGAGAVLIPAIHYTAWEQGLACRVALFRDWVMNETSIDTIRIAQVLKADGLTVAEGRPRLIGFDIGPVGLSERSLTATESCEEQSRLRLTLRDHQGTGLLPQKRKIATTGFEIPDSEGEDDEDYSWVDEDEGVMPPMPSQWQGSEDVLIPPPGELQAEEDQEGETTQDTMDDSPDELA